MDEMFLFDKINVLQAEMLNFNEKISPVKNTNKSQALMLPYPEENKWFSTCVSVVSAILKISVCITWPTIFPTIVYCIEGNSELFWQVTVVSCITALLLTLLVVSILCTSVQRIKAVLDESLTLLGNLLGKVKIFRYIYDILESDFARMNVQKVLYPLVILFSAGIILLIAYINKMNCIFYLLIMVISFTSGILCTNIYNILKSPEMIPFHSPSRVRMQFTEPSPPSSAVNKDLMTNEEVMADPSSTSSPLSDINYEYIETHSITAYLPNMYQETLEKAQQTLQLPFNLNFLRRM